MITLVLALFLIVGFLIADAVLDYIFVGIYALATTAILNNIISMAKHRKANYLGGVFLYLLMVIATALVQYIYF